MFQLLQVKVKFTLEQATRTQKERERESIGVALLFL